LCGLLSPIAGLTRHAAHHGATPDLALTRAEIGYIEALR